MKIHRLKNYNYIGITTVEALRLILFVEDSKINLINFTSNIINLETYLAIAKTGPRNSSFYILYFF
jgi:hypothetical protein